MSTTMDKLQPFIASESNKSKYAGLYELICVITQVYSKVQSLLLIFLSLPILFFSLIYYRGVLDRALLTSAWPRFFHLAITAFLLFNFTGNMIMNIITDKTLRGYINSKDNPPDYLIRSVEFYNRRHYILFIAYWAIMNTYVACCTLYYLTDIYGPNLYPVTVEGIKFLGSLMIGTMEKNVTEDSYILLLILTIFMAIWALWLTFLHVGKVVKGDLDSSDSYSDFHRHNFAKNVVKIFGTKWYWAIIVPFAWSPSLERDTSYENYNIVRGRGTCFFLEPVHYEYNRESDHYDDTMLKLQ